MAKVKVKDIATIRLRKRVRKLVGARDLCKKHNEAVKAALDTLDSWVLYDVMLSYPIFMGSSRR
jgi:hypothetical protein